MEDISGRTIKGYELREMIGAGGFGAVYRAYQPLIGREVAIKIILPQYANRPDFIRRFETEAQLVARLEHPFIVPLYDYWREPDGAYLVMRWLKGGSLQQSVEANGPWLARDVGQLLIQIGEALAVAHRQGVIHRDLKLENILLDENGNAFLTDFGIAKDLGDDSHITQGNAILGSPAYLSPERIKGEPITAQADIYALGIVVYELLTGEAPYGDTTAAALMFKHLSEPLPDVTSKRSDLPPELNGIMQKATAKELADRYQDVIAFVKDFRRAVRSHDESGVRPLPTTEVSSTGIQMPEPDNPYKGLRAFQQADAADFFGREELVDRLIERMNRPEKASKFLAVVGPSGSGKSSVVKAGVVPELRKGAIPGSENWFIVEMVPGADPMEELEAALLRIAVNPPASLLQQLNEDERGLLRAVRRVLPDDDTELVLVIDQFEELFTLVEEQKDRIHFMDSLVAAVTETRSKIHVLVTLRADFYDGPLNYARFGELLRENTEIVLPMSQEELETAITGPASRVGMLIEQSLITAIVSDVRDQPGALPLLQYALTELFERRDGNVLSLSTYEEIGGTLGALARRADELYDALGDDGQEAARQLFLRLVKLGEGAEDTRRRLPQAELLSIGDDPDTMSYIIDAFGRYRLLTFDNDPTSRAATVEVAHEALIRQWARLREWLAESREDLRIQQRLSASAREWSTSGKDASFLASGNRLQQLEDWRETTRIVLNALEQEYLQASIDQRKRVEAAEQARKEREEALEKRSRDRLRALVAVLGAAAVLASLLALVAFTQRQEAQEAQELAQANADQTSSLALSANARNVLFENDTTLALSLAIESSRAYEPAPVEVLRVLANTAFGPGVRHRYTGHTGAVLGSAISPDGTMSASAAADGTVRIWDNTTGDSVAAFDVADVVFTSVVFSPDGARIAASGTDSLVHIWDLESGEETGQLTGHEHTVTSVVYSVDGLRLLSGSLDRTLRLWDAETFDEIRVMEGHTGVVFDVALSPDGLYAASSSGDEVLTSDSTDEVDRTVRIWDVDTGAEILVLNPPPGYVRTVTFSPDGQYVAAATWNGTLGGTTTVWDVNSGEMVQRFFGHTDIVTSIAFSPDGTRLLSASWDRTLRVYDVATGREVNRFDTFEDRLLSLALSADGDHAVVTSGNIGGDEIEAARDVSNDTSVWLVDLDSRAEIRRFTGSEDWVWSMDISPDGTLAASGSGPFSGDPNDTSVRIWDIATGDMMMRMEGHTSTVEGVAFSPDGETVLSASWDGFVILWDIDTGEEIRRFGDEDGSHGGARAINVAFHPDGTMAASGGRDGSIILWNVATGEAIRTFDGAEGEVGNIAFSPDGTQLASASGDGFVRLWNVDTGEEIRQFGGPEGSHDGSANDVVFNSDGTRLLSSSWDGTVRLWNVETGEEIRRFTGHNGPTFGIDFSPDDAVIISGSSDGTVRVWDVATGQELRRLTGHTNWISEVQFTPDGRYALSSAQDNTLRLWQIPLSTEEIIAWAQDNRYVREPSCAERVQYRVEPLCAETDTD